MYLVCRTFDVNATTTASQCAFDTNQYIARRRFSFFLIVIRVRLQKVAHFSVVTLMGVIPNRVSNNFNLKIGQTTKRLKNDFISFYFPFYSLFVVICNTLKSIKYIIKFNSLPAECQYNLVYSPKHK